MIMQDTTLKEMIHIQREAIPSNICDSIIKNIENSDWQQHSWQIHLTMKLNHMIEN